MSEFQRFITYINLYEDNNKIRNVGFAKIERQQEQCKMEIHMKGTGYTGISCPVYLFIREEDKMSGVPVGKIQMAAGNGDMRLLLDAADLGGSGYALEQVGGFLIFVSEHIMFASLWDDKELLREQFVPIEKRQTPEQDSVAENTDRVPEQASAAESIDRKPEQASTPESTVRIAEQRAPQRAIKAAEAAVQPQVLPQKEEDWGRKWQFILENYPILTPFEGEEEILCVRMELKDLRLLPKRYWYLGNNSFLLHGFFNYRYLILGAMSKDDKKRWFLGVPGVFQSQEKVMAAIFGFPEYKSEKTVGQKTGQFGYWYRFLE